MSPIAKAPQKVTRHVARMTLAPPAFAPMAPKNARNSSEAADAAVSKEVFKLIKAGQLELAAVEAGKNDVTLEIWTKAVNAASI